MPCAVGRGGDPRDAVRRWRALSAGITRRVGEAEGDRAAGRFPIMRAGRAPSPVVVRAVRTPRRRARGRGVWPCDVRAIHSIVRVRHIRDPVRDRVSIILYRRLYSRRAPSPRTGVLLCRLVAAAIGATTAFTPRLVARARPPHKRDRESQSLLWRVHQPPAAMRIPNDSSHDEFLPT